MNSDKNFIKNFARALPIEFYCLIIPSIIIFLITAFSLKSFSINAFGTEAFIDSFAANHLNLVSLTLLLFALLCVAFEIISAIVLKIFRPKLKATHNNKVQKLCLQQFLSFTYIIILISFVGYTLVLTTGLLFKVADPTSVIKFSKLFFSWDRTIFKTDPGTWLINRFGGTVIESILLWIYINIFSVFSLLVLLSFFLNKKAFRKLILSFFISWIIALPIWFLFPAVSPGPMFRLNSLDAASPTEIKESSNFTPSAQLKEDFDLEGQVHTISLSPTDRSLPISTFPSMHAAWGVVTVYAGMIIYPWLGLLLIPLAVLNGISCVYILEHYAADIFLGTGVAITAIIITEILLAFEKKYFVDRFGLMTSFEYVKLKVKKFLGETESD